MDVQGVKWQYISKKKFKSMGVTHQKIVGDVFRKTRKRPIEQVLHYDQQTQLKVFPYREKLSIFDNVVGYIPCEKKQEEVYVRIVKKNWLKLVFFISFFSLLVGSGILYFCKDRGPNLDETAVAYQMPGNKKNEDPSSIMLPAFNEIKLASDTKKMHIALANPEGNPCYFKYKLILSETDEILYESEYIEPGKAITEFSISRTLNPGNYQLKLKIETRKLDNFEQSLNSGDIEIPLIVS